MKLYMAITPDAYELPMAVCSSAGELARMFGVTQDVVWSSISHGCSGKNRGAKFISIELEDSDSEDDT